jgi:transcriptional regulator GlxA family with amidase domain
MPMRSVVVVLFPGFALLDAAGPVEVFGDLPDHFRVWTAALRVGAVRSAQGPTLIAHYPLSACPAADILVVPGGPGVRQAVDNDRLRQLLHGRASSAEVVLSVCTGAALLARTGMLAGHRATSNKAALAWVAEQAADVEWIGRARWIESGKFVTSSGVTAGIDAALAVVARLVGERAAVDTAQLIEHERRLEHTDDPFAR